MSNGYLHEIRIFNLYSSIVVKMQLEKEETKADFMKCPECGGWMNKGKKSRRSDGNIYYECTNPKCSVMERRIKYRKGSNEIVKDRIIRCVL